VVQVRIRTRASGNSAPPDEHIVRSHSFFDIGHSFQVYSSDSVDCQVIDRSDRYPSRILSSQLDDSNLTRLNPTQHYVSVAFIVFLKVDFSRSALAGGSDPPRKRRSSAGIGAAAITICLHYRVTLNTSSKFHQSDALCRNSSESSPEFGGKQTVCRRNSTRHKIQQICDNPNWEKKCRQGSCLVAELSDRAITAWNCNWLL
jgi:hypothetical protein